MKKIKLLIASTVLTSSFVPTILFSCASNQKDSRDQTDDANVGKVEIPTIEVNKSFDIKVTLKDGYIIDGNNTIITIGGKVLSYNENDFKIISQGNSVSLIVRVNAQKVTSTNVTVKIVSKEKPSSPCLEIIGSTINLEVTHNALTNKYFYPSSQSNKQELGIRIDGIDLSSEELKTWTFAIIEKSSEQGKDYFKQAGFAFDETNNNTLIWKCPNDGFVTIPTSSDSKKITLQAKKGDTTINDSIPLLIQEPHVCEIRNVPTIKPTINFRYYGIAYRNLGAATISNVSMEIYDTTTHESYTPEKWSSKVYKKDSQELVADVNWKTNATNKTISIDALSLAIQPKFWTSNTNEFEVKFIGEYKGSTYVTSTNMTFTAIAKEAVITSKQHFLTAINDPNISYIRLGGDIQLKSDELITINRSLKIDGWDSKHRIYSNSSTFETDFASLFTIIPGTDQNQIDVEFTNLNLSFLSHSIHSSVIKVNGDFSKLTSQPVIKINNTTIQNYNVSNNLDYYGLVICPDVGKTLNPSLGLKVEITNSKLEALSAVYNEASNVDFTANNSIFFGYSIHTEHENYATIIASDYAIATTEEKPDATSKSFGANNKFNFINCEIKSEQYPKTQDYPQLLIENRSLANNIITLDDNTVNKSQCDSQSLVWYATAKNDFKLQTSNEFFALYTKPDKPSNINTYDEYVNYYTGDKLSHFVVQNPNEHFNTGELTQERKWDFSLKVVGGSTKLVVDPDEEGSDSKKWILQKGGQKVNADFQIQMVNPASKPNWLNLEVVNNECTVKWTKETKIDGYTCCFKIHARLTNSNVEYDSPPITLTVSAYHIVGLPNTSLQPEIINFEDETQQIDQTYYSSCGNQKYTTPNEVKLMFGKADITSEATIEVKASCGPGKSTIKSTYSDQRIHIGKWTILEHGMSSSWSEAGSQARAAYRAKFNKEHGSYANPFTITISMKYQDITYTGEFKVEFKLPEL